MYCTMTTHNKCGTLVFLFCGIVLTTFSEQTSFVAASEQPVISIKPTPQADGTTDSLIWYHSTNVTSFSNWTRSLERFLDAYRRPGLVPGRSQSIFNCDYDMPPRPGQVCDIDARQWYPCVAENHFNYHRGGPCVFVKLDTPVGWVPEFYNDTESLPAAMPEYLKLHIRTLVDRNSPGLNSVWISCEGVYPADVEFVGPTAYYPRVGIPGYYFLNNDAEGYLSPLVAVHFEHPAHGVLINIKCQAWARNINNTNVSTSHNGVFSLMID